MNATAVDVDKAISEVIGTVISNKMDKTIVVSVQRRVRHPLYGKYIVKTSKFHAHDEDNQCQEGDKVAIVECRPYSKKKSWKLHRVIESQAGE